MGVSCFKIELLENQEINFENITYNIYTFCTDDFMLEPSAIKFLSDQGFDFNKNFRCGVGYHKGNDRETDKQTKEYIRCLFSQISLLEIPIVLHNGFIDLIFLYENFYAKCPENSMKFVADLSEIFKAGIFDTKYIAEYHAKSNASFLEYLFKIRYANSYPRNSLIWY